MFFMKSCGLLYRNRLSFTMMCYLTIRVKCSKIKTITPRASCDWWNVYIYIYILIYFYYKMTHVTVNQSHAMQKHWQQQVIGCGLHTKLGLMQWNLTALLIGLWPAWHLCKLNSYWRITVRLCWLTSHVSNNRNSLQSYYDIIPFNLTDLNCNSHSELSNSCRICRIANWSVVFGINGIEISTNLNHLSRNVFI